MFLPKSVYDAHTKKKKNYIIVNLYITCSAPNLKCLQKFNYFEIMT